MGKLNLFAYIVNEELPHNEEKAAPQQLMILKQIFEKDKNIDVFTEYLVDEKILQLKKNLIEKTYLYKYREFIKFCMDNNIPVLSISVINHYYTTNDMRSVLMFKYFLHGYHTHFYGKEEKNLVFFMGESHSGYFEAMLEEMGYTVFIYRITLEDKEQGPKPIFPYKFTPQND